EREPSVGLIAAHYMLGDQPAGTGVPFTSSRMPGREACRMMLLSGDFPLGSPTTVMYRAEVVRARRPFFPVGRYHDDTEAAYEVLLEHDLGFVHQILSFVRTDNVSITLARQQ